jgi:hypothetical protein
MHNISEEDQKTPNKPELIKRQLDSETCDSSKKDSDIYNINEFQNAKDQKKSIDFFPKKMNIEELDNSSNIFRKYTVETKLMIKDFVPQIRPIKTHIVPPKLRLNKKGFRDLKCNKKNKILLNSHQYYISCPNSEDEDTDKYNSSKEKMICIYKVNKMLNFGEKTKNFNESIDINEMRKDLKKTKIRKIDKNYSKKDLSIKGKFSKEFNLDNSFESDLYNFEEIDNYSLLAYDKKEYKIDQLNNDEKIIKKYRTRSYSILEMLQKKLEKDDNEE